MNWAGEGTVHSFHTCAVFHVERGTGFALRVSEGRQLWWGSAGFLEECSKARHRITDQYATWALKKGTQVRTCLYCIKDSGRIDKKLRTSYLFRMLWNAGKRMGKRKEGAESVFSVHHQVLIDF